MINRRKFLQYSLAAGGLAGLQSYIPTVQAAGAATQKTLINVMLLGGADFRFLFAPDPISDAEYASQFARARATLYPISNNPSNYESKLWGVADPYYIRPAVVDYKMGIHRNAGWLIQQFNANNVAIICNSVGSENRQHDHSQLIMDAGDVQTSRIDTNRDGWGGRLAEEIGAANIVATTNNVSVFCRSRNVQNQNDRVIHASDTRKLFLLNGDEPNANGAVDQNRARLGRALKSYYKSKRIETASRPADWPFKKFLQHEDSLRRFGDIFRERLNLVAPDRPAEIEQLYTGSTAAGRLYQTYFGQQCGNVYDSFVAADILKFRIASMELGGWDTHQNQRVKLEQNINDIFGAGGGLDILSQQLNLLSSNIPSNLVYVFTTDFGRQLRANGTNGTDHGRGNYMIVIGDAVKGGVYGEMFPRSEIVEASANGSIRYEQRGADITGLTSFEHVLAAVCDWVQPGSGSNVFPNLNSAKIEPGVDLSGLFA